MENVEHNLNSVDKFVKLYSAQSEHSVQLMFSMEIRCKQTAVLLYTIATIAIHGVRAKNLNIKTNANLSNVRERKSYVCFR